MSGKGRDVRGNKSGPSKREGIGKCGAKPMQEEDENVVLMAHVGNGKVSSRYGFLWSPAKPILTCRPYDRNGLNVRSKQSLAPVLCVLSYYECMSLGIDGLFTLTN